MFKPGTRVWDPTTMKLATVVGEKDNVVLAVFDTSPTKVVYVPAGRLQVKEGLDQPADAPGNPRSLTYITDTGETYTRNNAVHYDHGWMCSTIEQIHTVAVLAIGGDIILTPEYYRGRLAEIAQKCVQASDRIVLPKFYPPGNRAGIILYRPNTTSSANTTTQEG